MKVKVVYESLPYEKDGALIKFNNNGRSICSQIVEVNDMSDIYKAIEEDGFSNHIMYRQVLDDDYDEEQNFNDIVKQVNEEVSNDEYTIKLEIDYETLKSNNEALSNLETVDLSSVTGGKGDNLIKLSKIQNNSVYKFLK